MEADGNVSRGDPVAPSGPSTMTSTRIESSESGPHEHASPSLGVSESAAPVQIQDANGRERAEITVHVKFIHHESVALVCAPTITIAELRRRVMEVEHARASGSDEDGSEPPRLRLIYKGKVLKDDQTLDAYNFQHEDTIHAVLGRPQTPSTPASASLAPAPPVQDRPIESISGEVDDTGNGFVMGRFNTGTDVSPVDLGSLLGSVISGTMFGAAGATSAAPGVSMQVSFASGTVPASSAPTSTSYTRVTAATTTSASLPTTSTSTTTSARYAATASSGSSSTTPAAAMSGVSPARAHFLAQTTAAANQRITNASAFQGQAGAVRRMMPPIDLGPMSRPQALSEEMYELGNAVREASDTFMALHRQLAHLSGRLLNENNLSSLERARLRMQIQRLGPVLRGASGMSTSLDQLLSESSLGWPTRSTPATPSNANGPPPGPASSAGAPPARPEPRSDAGAGQASSRPSFWDNLQRGGNHPQPGGSDPVDDNLFMTELASYYEELHQSAIPESGAPQTQANEASSSFSRNSGSASTPPSTVDRRQHGTNVITSRSTDPAGRPPSASDSNRPSLSALNYLQRLSESARSSTSGVGALGSILTETGNLLSQFQSSERPTSAPSSAPLNTVGRANIGVPADSSSASSARMAASLRTGIGLSSPPIISTTPISDLIATTMSRCVGTLENDIGEFYHHSSDFMRSMFPASLPELEIQERRKEWRVRAMNEIVTKASYCCDGELVCRHELLSPAMDDALDAFIRECLDASFLTSGVLADSVESPIHNAWIKIWTNVRSWVNRQPASTGRLILSRILVEEIRDAAIRLDLQDLVRRLYDRTMACVAALVFDNEQATAQS